MIIKYEKKAPIVRLIHWAKIFGVLLLISTVSSTWASSVALVPTTNITGVVTGDTVSFNIFIDFTTDGGTLGGGFDVVFDPTALSYQGLTSAGLGDPAFSRNPDILSGQLESWAVGDFNGLAATGPELVGNVQFQVLPSMGALTTVQVTSTSGVGGPWVSGVDFVTILQPEYNSVDVEGPAVCGDSILSGLEQCDDGNATPGDGCSSTCQIEVGFVCTLPIPGIPPTPSDCTPAINIEKATNGVDADSPNGGDTPQIAPGEVVSWTYAVTNNGIEDLTNVTVIDDQGVVVACPQTTLTAGETMICTASAIAEDLSSTSFTTVLGLCGAAPNELLYRNIGRATGDYLGQQVEDTDLSHYCNPAGANQAPIAVDNNYNPDEDTQLVGNVITDDTGDGVDSDADNDGLSIISNSDVTNGVLVINPDGSFTYNPDLNYCGPDSFTYQITDDPPLIEPALTSNTATVSLTVVCVNDPPVVTTVVTDAQSSDYSDAIAQVVITVVDADNISTTLAESDEPPLSAAGLTLTSTGCIEDETDSPAENGSSCTWNYNGTVLDPGDNVYVIVFTPSDTDGTGITGSHTLTIEPEDATVELAAGNGVAFKSHDDGEFHLLFSAWETVPDLAGGSPLPGDLNEMVPYMELVPLIGPGETEIGLCSIKDPTNPGDGYAQVAMFDCVFDAPAKTYEVNAWVDGASDTTRYYIGSDDGQISVLNQTATSVPTLPQWSMILLSFLLTLVAYSGVRRNRR